LKVGQFSFSQQDLVIPVHGFPISVVRTYDSLQANSFQLTADSSDFGPGWTYSISDVQFQLDEQRTQTEDVDGTIFSMRSGGGRDITLTMPDGRRTTFRFSLTRASGNESGGLDPRFVYVAKWTATSGVYATLKPNTDNRLVTLFGLNYWAAAGLGTPIESYDFPSFTLTTSDGTQYVLQRQDLGEHFTLSNDGTSSFVHAYGQGKLTRILEVSGDRIEFSSTTVQAFNANGELTKGILFHRDGQGRIDALYDPIHLNNGVPTGPAAVTYEYDGAGNLVKVKKLTDESNPSSPLYSTIEYVYGDSRFPHYITAIKDPSGHTPLRTLYDNNGRMIGTEDANGNITHINHDLAARTETVFDRLGNPTIYGYDTRGNVISSTDALGHTTTYAYTDGANPDKETSVTDPLGHTTTMTYDSRGNETSITDPLGHTTTMTYDALGNLLTTTDPLGNTSTIFYDAHGNRIAVEDALGNVTTITHDANNDPIALTNALGQLRATTSYDASGNVMSISEIGGFTTNYAYDANGNELTWGYIWMNPNHPSDTQVITSQTFYDAAGRVIRTVDPLGNEATTAYDANGQPFYFTDQFGNVTEYMYL
jgi:YD repeat-containing protein